MQIELIGCTSAGKSTLLRRILRACRAQNVDVLPGDDFVLKQLRLNWIKNRPLRAVVLNLSALLVCLMTWRRNRELVHFATRLLLPLPIGRVEKIGLLRNVLKKIGTYEIIRYRSRGDEVILVDEGVLQIAHNLFVHVTADTNAADLATFAGLIPLPDVAVYLRQPEARLIGRIMQRGHGRIPEHSDDSVARFVQQAVATFDSLVHHPHVADRVLIVDGHRGALVNAGRHDAPAVAFAAEIVRYGLTADTRVTAAPAPAQI